MKKVMVWIIVIIIFVTFAINYHNSLDSKNVNNGAIDSENDNNTLNDIKTNDGIADKDDNIIAVIEKKDNEAEVIKNIDEDDIKDEIKNEDSEKEDSVTQNVNKSEEKIETIAGSYSSLSNKTCAWGFVRKSDGIQPEFYGPHAKVLDVNEGIYVGSKDEPVIYLTFDEGYENGYTAPILDTLKEKDVSAIFFVTMPYVKQNPDLVKRMIEEGHIVGNHTVNHPSMPEVTSDEKLINEVMELHNYVKENFNYEMTYLRPPKGEYSERTVKLSLDLGYRTVLWSGAYDDWDTAKQDRLDYGRKMILNYIHNGEVMLLHAVSKDNAALLGEVIDTIREKGYEFLSLDEFER